MEVVEGSIDHIIHISHSGSYDLYIVLDFLTDETARILLLMGTGGSNKKPWVHTQEGKMVCILSTEKRNQNIAWDVLQVTALLKEKNVSSV